MDDSRSIPVTFGAGILLKDNFKVRENLFGVTEIFCAVNLKTAYRVDGLNSSDGPVIMLAKCKTVYTTEKGNWKRLTEQLSVALLIMDILREKVPFRM